MAANATTLHAASTSPGPGVDASAGESGHYLTFLLGDGLFATDIRSVREIIQHGPMTAMPLMPHFVRGVINLRGAVVPVIDLHARFGHAPARLGRKSCIVLVEVVRAGERQALGLLVDAVSAVVQIAAAAIEPAPSFGTAVRRDFIQAMGRVGQRFVVILAPDKTFDIDDMAQLCDAALAQAA